MYSFLKLEQEIFVCLFPDQHKFLLVRFLINFNTLNTMFLLSVYYVKYGKTGAFIVKVYPSVQEFDNMPNVQVIAHFIPHGPLTGNEEFVLYW